MSNINLFISSAAASQKELNGSKLFINLSSSIDLTNKKCRLLKSSIWYTFPNISETNGNNEINFTYDGNPYKITFTRGLYSLSDINDALRESLHTHLALPPDMISFLPDEATGSCSLFVDKLNNKPFTLQFSALNNKLLNTMLGFNLNPLITTSTSVYIASTTKASLNQINSLYVHVDFINSKNNFLNNSSSRILSSVHINVSPSSLILGEDIHPPWSPCLSGPHNNFHIWITDERNEPVDMNNEDWTCNIEITDI